jgi:CRISPR/Cas system type I-B associated protein Csh2 (Cas7 group RAMP superfamily)
VSSAKIRDLLQWKEPADVKEVQYSDYQITLNQDKLDEYKEKGLHLEILEGL